MEEENSQAGGRKLIFSCECTLNGSDFYPGPFTKLLEINGFRIGIDMVVLPDKKSRKVFFFYVRTKTLL